MTEYLPKAPELRLDGKKKAKLEIDFDVSVASLLGAGIGAAGMGAVAGGPVGAVAGMLQGIASVLNVKLKDREDRLARKLVTKSFMRAVRCAIGENWDVLSDDDLDSFLFAQLEAKVDAYLKESPVMTMEGLENPGVLDCFENLRSAYMQYLRHIGSDAREGWMERYANEFRYLFTRAMDQEWSSDPQRYGVLLDVLGDSPQRRILEMQCTYYAYREKIISKFTRDKAWGEDIPLQKLYIPMHAGVWNPKNSKYEDQSCIDVSKQICDWHQNHEKTIRALIGGPGYGKSTVALAAAVEMMRQGKIVYYLPVQEMVTNDIARAIVSYVNKISKMYYNYIDFENLNQALGASAWIPTMEQCCIIMDGLDEFSVEYISDSLVELIKEIKKFRRQYDCNVLLCGRDETIKELTGIPDIEIWRLYPYTLRQQQDWWAQYDVHHPEISAPTYLDEKESVWHEVSEVPVLTFLIAQVLKERKYDFSSQNASKNEIYYQFVCNTIGRSWTERAGETFIDPANLEPIMMYLGKLAFASSSLGAGRKLNISEMEEKMGLSSDERNVDRILRSKDPSHKSQPLMLLFFFYPSKDKKANEIEFIHKSFTDYLTSWWLFNNLREWASWTDEERVLWIMRHLGHAYLSHSVFQFFAGEIATYIGANHIDVSNRWEELNIMQIGKTDNPIMTSLYLLYDMIYQYGECWPYEMLATRRSAKIERRHTMSANLNIMNIVGMFAAQLHFRYEGLSIDNYLFLEFYPDALLRYSNLSGMYVLNISSDHYESSLNIQYAELVHVSFHQCSFLGSNFFRSNLCGADFSYCLLNRSNFRYTILTNADFKCADLQEAYFGYADIQSADFKDADLKYADFEHADLRNADLRGADLSGVFFLNANLQNADFSNATLLNADLRGSIMKGASFLNTDLRDANLSNVDLKNVNLQDAILHNEDLSDRISQNTDSEDADLFNEIISQTN